MRSPRATPRRALAIADEMNARSISFAQAMRDLASLLHRLALIQQVASAADDEVDADELRRLASAFAPDEIQLFYQIALHGRNEMHLAPDEYAGFTMALMRMLAFAPTETPSRAGAGTAFWLGYASHARTVRRRAEAQSLPKSTASAIETPKRNPTTHRSTATGRAWSRGSRYLAWFASSRSEASWFRTTGTA